MDFVLCIVLDDVPCVNTRIRRKRQTITLNKDTTRCGGIFGGGSGKSSSSGVVSDVDGGDKPSMFMVSSLISMSKSEPPIQTCFGLGAEKVQQQQQQQQQQSDYVVHFNLNDFHFYGDGSRSSVIDGFEEMSTCKRAEPDEDDDDDVDDVYDAAAATATMTVTDDHEDEEKDSLEAALSTHNTNNLTYDLSYVNINDETSGTLTSPPTPTSSSTSTTTAAAADAGLVPSSSCFYVIKEEEEEEEKEKEKQEENVIYQDTNRGEQKKRKEKQKKKKKTDDTETLYRRVNAKQTRPCRPMLERDRAVHPVVCEPIMSDGRIVLEIVSGPEQPTTTTTTVTRVDDGEAGAESQEMSMLVNSYCE